MVLQDTYTSDRTCSEYPYSKRWQIKRSTAAFNMEKSKSRLIVQNFRFRMKKQVRVLQSLLQNTLGSRVIDPIMNTSLSGDAYRSWKRNFFSTKIY